jgi:glycosyltransferase involved in cell wall biosynthesis
VAEPALTIAICTHDRADMLDRALASFASIEGSANEAVEVLVVDNASRDHTTAVVGAWMERRRFHLRHASEPRLGLSSARNRAVRQATGRWTWFVDDDVVFARTFLAAALDAVRTFEGVAAIAGKVTPRFEAPRPHWLGDSLLAFYGVTEFGERRRLLHGDERPVGANLAFRTDVLREIGPFRRDLGRVGSHLASSEETDVVMRLHERGLHVGYEPGAEVYHRVTAERVTMRWLCRRAYEGGASEVLTERATSEQGSVALLAGSARRAARAARLVLTSPLRPRSYIASAWQLGMARASVAAALGRRPRSEPER